jgi:hypothetical protein
MCFENRVYNRDFSPGTPASSTTKTGRHDIAEILLKVALKHQPEVLKSLYRSPGYKKNQLVLCKNYVLQW